ncbi:unnamed protein product [Arctogadus glacialis]
MDPGTLAAACSSDATDWNLQEVSYGPNVWRDGHCTSMGRVSSRSKLGAFSRGGPPQCEAWGPRTEPRSGRVGVGGSSKAMEERGHERRTRREGAEARGRSLGSGPRGGPDGEHGAWGANRDVEGVVLVLEGGGVKTPSQTRGGREDTSCLDCVVRGGKGLVGVALELLQMRWMGESVNETAAIPHIPTRQGTRPAHQEDPGVNPPRTLPLSP